MMAQAAGGSVAPTSRRTGSTRMSDGSMARGCARLAALFALVAIVPGCGRGDDAAAPAGPPPAIIGPENIAVAAETTLTAGPPLSGSLEPELAATCAPRWAARCSRFGPTRDSRSSAVSCSSGSTTPRSATPTCRRAPRCEAPRRRCSWRGATPSARSGSTGRGRRRARRRGRAGQRHQRRGPAGRRAGPARDGREAAGRRPSCARRSQGVVANVTVSEGDVVQTGEPLLGDRRRTLQHAAGGVGAGRAASPPSSRARRSSSR